MPMNFDNYRLKNKSNINVFLIKLPSTLLNTILLLLN